MIEISKKERYKKARNITLAAATITAFLGFIKTIGGLALNSHALFADGLHSFADLFVDVMVLFASKYGSQEADISHPYGHQRIETAATLFLSMILVLTGSAIGWHAFEEILQGIYDVPGVLTIPIALFSIIANEGLFQYTHYIGKRIESKLILANAWHHRSDAASSVVVLIGLIGSLLGWIYLDAIAAIIVGASIIKMGLNYGWNSVKELVDTAVSSDLLNEIEQTIQSVSGVHKTHQLRTRMMGKDVFVDAHILVDPFISVSEGHFIAQQVHHKLLEKIKSVADVTIHVDPEDDEIYPPSLTLPTREFIESNMVASWQQQFSVIQSFILHYLNNTIIIDLFCDDINQNTNNDKMLQEINQDISAQNFKIIIRIFYHGESV